MNIYNTDIWNYIANFHDILEKFKAMKYKLNKWYINNWFISRFHNWQSTFIQIKKNKLRDQNKDKINKINQNQIMNLLIIRTINYENKNKNKKFNNTFKAEASENKNEFKSHKDKTKNETKLKKSNEMSISTTTSDNIEKKKFIYINYNYCERWHSVSCFYKHSEFVKEKWQKINKIEINHFKEKNKLKKKKIILFNFNFSSDFSAQTQSKILIIQKKNFNWYLDNNVSFHVFDEKNKFMNL